MGTDLQYNIENMNANIDKITLLQTEISQLKAKLLEALAQVRIDWQSDGGDEFFKLVDQDWCNGIDACVSLLEDLDSTLTSAKVKYISIEVEAQRLLQM